MKKILSRFFCPALLLVILSVVYAMTLAPGLTWANRGADGGDLITAAATGGVAHPPGYPTYLILARLFQMLPWGNLAFRTNLMSAVFAVFTAVIVADLSRRSFAAQKGIARWAGFIAGLAFGLSQLFWSQAVITEVYTLNAFFVVLILWLMPLSQEIQLFGKAGFLNQSWLDCLGGLLFGLALGNQITVIFLLPPWLLVGILRKQGGKGAVGRSPWHPSTLGHLMDWRSLARRAGWLLIGLTIYITIPIRARSGSPVNWGNAVNWDGFWWLISGGAYQERVFSLPVEYLWPRIRNWAGWLQTQYGLIGLVLGFYGLLYGSPRSKRFYWITGWMFISYSAFSIGYSSSDSYALLIPAYMAFALWLGLGVGKLLQEAEKLKQKVWLLPLAGALTFVVILFNAVMIFPDVDASQDARAEEFAQLVMDTAPPGAIIFTSDDEDIFALRYYTYALGQRPDIAVFSGAMQFGWYREVMRATYPDVVIPELAGDCIPCIRSALIAANNRPICETFPLSSDALVCQP